MGVGWARGWGWGWGLGRAAWAVAGLAALAVGAFYYAASPRETFSSATRRLKDKRLGQPPPAAPPPAPGGGGEGGVGVPGGSGSGSRELHVLMALAQAERNAALLAKAEVALGSLARRTRLPPGQALALHLLCDAPSKPLAEALLRTTLQQAPFPHQVRPPPPLPGGPDPPPTPRPPAKGGPFFPFPGR